MYMDIAITTVIAKDNPNTSVKLISLNIHSTPDAISIIEIIKIGTDNK